MRYYTIIYLSFTVIHCQHSIYTSIYIYQSNCQKIRQTTWVVPYNKRRMDEVLFYKHEEAITARQTTETNQQTDHPIITVMFKRFWIHPESSFLGSQLQFIWIPFHYNETITNPPPALATRPCFLRIKTKAHPSIINIFDVWTLSTEATINCLFMFAKS